VLQIKAPISLSLSTSASATTAPRAISAAFGDSDVIRKRRENVLQWRMEREAARKAEEAVKAAETAQQMGNNGSFENNEGTKLTESDMATPAAPSKPWSWEDDDDDDDEPDTTTQKDAAGDIIMDGKNEGDAAMDEDEIDPLDAFMVDVTAEVKELEKKEQKRDSKFGKAADMSKPDSISAQKPPGNDEDEEDVAEPSEEEEEDILAIAAKRIKKKDIPAVDHSKIQYEFFRKDFYMEPPEMVDMTPEEVHSLRLELDGIKIRGADCPKPIRKWTQAGLPPGW